MIFLKQAGNTYLAHIVPKDKLFLTEMHGLHKQKLLYMLCLWESILTCQRTYLCNSELPQTSEAEFCWFPNEISTSVQRELALAPGMTSDTFKTPQIYKAFGDTTKFWKQAQQTFSSRSQKPHQSQQVACVKSSDLNFVLGCFSGKVNISWDA